MALLLASVAWAIALLVDSGQWGAEAGGVIGAGVVVVVAVSVAAMMIENSRLGYWLGVSAVVIMLAVAAFRSVDAYWVSAVSLTGAAGVLMADRRLGGWIRLEGPVAPVPDRAIALGLVLLLAPILTALSLTGPGGTVVWLALAAWAILIVFVRRWPGAVVVARVGGPALVGASAFLALPGAAVWGTLMLLASALAWTKSVRLAICPLIERGSRVSIPPELLSDEMRRAAGIDRDRSR